MYIITIIPKWHTAHEHVIGKSETLNILSCERVFIAVENWMFLVVLLKMNGQMQSKLDK